MRCNNYLAVGGLLAFISCSTVPPPDFSPSPDRVDPAEPAVLEDYVYVPEDEEPPPEIVDFIPLTVPPLPGDEDMDSRLFMPEQLEALPPPPTVQRIIEYYKGEAREKFQNSLNRLAPVYEMVADIFKEEGLPEHYLYLGLVESAFKVHARSRMGAYGPWQFMTSTARLYGLTVNPIIDERATWDLATRAAARLIKRNFDDMGSLELALAAYNSGTGNVRRAMKRCRDDDFWKIRRCLPRETRNFVPSVLAAMAIGENLESNGFSFPESNPLPVTSVDVPTAVNLKKLSENLGLAKDTLLALNPQYVTGYTPLEGAPVLVPEEIGASILNSIPSHTCIEGDTLGSISSKYKVDLATLTKANQMDRSRNLNPGDVLYIPELPRRFTYKVQKGDNPWSIARKFGVSLSKLLAVNHLGKRSKIFPGQKLIIPGRTYHDNEEGALYRVMKGDTLYSIARKFNTSIGELKKLNGLSSNLIHPGDLLTVN